MDRDFYSVTEAAKILKLTTGGVWQMLRSGDLEGISAEETGDLGWRILCGISLEAHNRLLPTCAGLVGRVPFGVWENETERHLTLRTNAD